MAENLQLIADQVVRLAQQQGYVVPTDVRRLLNEAELDGDLWKDVTALTKPNLHYRSGRYYYDGAGSEVARQMQDHQRQVEQAVLQLIKMQRKSDSEIERRDKHRTLFIHPVVVKTTEGQSLKLLTRDVSSTGIRLIGTHRLLGQKVEVLLHGPLGINDSEVLNWTFTVRILWTCEVGDGLFENGGSLLGVRTSL